MKKNLGTKGFTLVEVLTTILLVGGLFMLFGAAISASRLTRDIKFQEIALRIAGSELEAQRAYGYGTTTSRSVSDPQLSLLPGGTGTTTVADYNAKTKQVTVEVGWSGAGVHRDVTLTTLITQVGGL